jgi:hypothetical protein
MKETPITKFEPKNLDALRPIIQKALTVLEEYRLTATLGKFTYSDTSFTTKVEVKTHSDGESEFRKNATFFKLKPRWFGKTFQDGKNTFEIIGLNQARSKFPVEVRNTETQKTLSYSADGIRQLLGDSAQVDKERRDTFAQNWQWLEYDKPSDLHFGWLGKQITINSAGTKGTVLGLDNTPWGRKKPNVVIDVDGTLKTATVENFVAVMKQHNKKLLKAA